MCSGQCWIAEGAAPQEPVMLFITVFHVWLLQVENTESLAQAEQPHLTPEQNQKL